ncbi:hypothetical protein A471_00085 [Ectopseudomonas mendocina DLHK]|nr:hypothetical protein A471_00085 [Pseudomonas mendocina DLHK]
MTWLRFADRRWGDAHLPAKHLRQMARVRIPDLQAMSMTLRSVSSSRLRARFMRGRMKYCEGERPVACLNIRLCLIPSQSGGEPGEL